MPKASRKDAIMPEIPTFPPEILTKPITDLPNFVRDKNGNYRASKTCLTDQEIVEAATVLLNQRMLDSEIFGNPSITKAFLCAHFYQLEHEVFACLFLNNHHQLIAVENMFRGTIDGANVYPREVVKRALQLNAAAAIFAHNHPSGNIEPSPADKHITKKLKEALALVDIRALDHIIVGKGEVYSFAEYGLI